MEIKNMSNDDGIYTMNTALGLPQLYQEAEGLLMSVMTNIEILCTGYSKQLPDTQQYYLKTILNTMLQLLILYDAVFSFQSSVVNNYLKQKNTFFLLNSMKTKEQCEEQLLGSICQLEALCEEGLRGVLLDYFNDRGGNLLMNTTVQIQLLKQLMEEIQLKQQADDLA